MKYKFIFLLVIMLLFSLFFNTSCEMLIRTIDQMRRAGTSVGEAYNEAIREIEREDSVKNLGVDSEFVEEKIAENEAEEAAKTEAELEEGFKDYPNEPVTYNGIIGDNDFYITMEVDLEGKEVSGTVYNNWEISYLTADIDGVIDLTDYKIEADCDGFFVNRETDVSEDVHMKIDGYLSKNLNNFSGSLTAEGFGTKSFIAEKD